jgi:hypothetical protein
VQCHSPEKAALTVVWYCYVIIIIINNNNCYVMECYFLYVMLCDVIEIRPHRGVVLLPVVVRELLACRHGLVREDGGVVQQLAPAAVKAQQQGILMKCRRSEDECRGQCPRAWRAREQTSWSDEFGKFEVVKPVLACCIVLPSVSPHSFMHARNKLQSTSSNCRAEQVSR